MSAIAAIKARTIVANDLHRGIINLANMVKYESQCLVLQNELRNLLFHPDTLSDAQYRFFGRPGVVTVNDPFQNALDYFVIAWMTRSGVAGTRSEATAGLSIRWEAGGGDSAKRYYSAIEALADWHKEFQRCTFQCLDCFDFLAKCQDKAKHGLYVDPPFFGPGDKYLHSFGEHELSGHQHIAVIAHVVLLNVHRRPLPVVENRNLISRASPVRFDEDARPQVQVDRCTRNRIVPAVGDDACVDQVGEFVIGKDRHRAPLACNSISASTFHAQCDR